MAATQTREADRKYIEAQNQGYAFWGSYELQPQVDNAIKNLRHWGAKVKTIRYPNGVTVVMAKHQTT